MLLGKTYSRYVPPVQREEVVAGAASTCNVQRQPLDLGSARAALVALLVKRPEVAEACERENVRKRSTRGQTETALPPTPSTCATPPEKKRVADGTTPEPVAVRNARKALACLLASQPKPVHKTKQLSEPQYVVACRQRLEASPPLPVSGEEIQQVFGRTRPDLDGESSSGEPDEVEQKSRPKVKAAKKKRKPTLKKKPAANAMQTAGQLLRLIGREDLQVSSGGKPPGQCDSSASGEGSAAASASEEVVKYRIERYPNGSAGVRKFWATAGAKQNAKQLFTVKVPGATKEVNNDLALQAIAKLEQAVDVEVVKQWVAGEKERLRRQ